MLCRIRGVFWHPNSGLADSREKKVSKAVAKERSVRKKKASRSGKSQHDTEILRARRAVSAALSAESSADPLPAGASAMSGPAQAEPPLDADRLPVNSSSPAGIPAVMKGLIRVAAGLVGHSSGSVTDDRPPVVYSSVAVSSDPLADLVRRHIARSGKPLIGPQDPTDRLCREVLANLAQVRLDTVLQSPSKPTRI